MNKSDVETWVVINRNLYKWYFETFSMAEEWKEYLAVANPNGLPYRIVHLKEVS